MKQYLKVRNTWSGLFNLEPIAILSNARSVVRALNVKRHFLRQVQPPYVGVITALQSQTDILIDGLTFLPWKIIFSRSRFSVLWIFPPCYQKILCMCSAGKERDIFFGWSERIIFMKFQGKLLKTVRTKAMKQCFPIPKAHLLDRVLLGSKCRIIMSEQGAGSAFCAIFFTNHPVACTTEPFVGRISHW